jgi:hypothetical protein
MPAPLSPPTSFTDLMSLERPQYGADASMGSNVWGSDSVSSLAESDRSDAANAEAAASSSPSSHAIELSLCGALMNHTNRSAADLAAAFAAHRVSWQSLSARPDLVFAPELVVRFGRQLFPGKVALPLLFSYLAFGTPLSDEALRALANNSSQAQPLASSSVPAQTQSAASEMGISPAAAVSSASALAPSSALASEAPAAVPQESRGFMSWLRGSRKNNAAGNSTSSNASLSASSSVSSLASNAASTSAPPSSSSIPSSGSASPALVASTASAVVKASAIRPAAAAAAAFPPLVELALEDDAAANTNGSGDPPIAADNATNADESESGGIRGDGRDTEATSSTTTAATLAAVSAVATAAARPFRSLRPSSSVLRSFGLRPGMNSVTFAVSSRLQGVQTVEAHIFLWRADAKVVISDIDGTITKSDFLGNVMPLVGRDWSHEGVAGLFASIASNGYQFMYLTSRAIGQVWLK